MPQPCPATFTNHHGPWALIRRAGVSANSLTGLRVRLAAETNLPDALAIAETIREREERLTTLPQHLSREVREEIAELEGQLTIHSRRYGAEKDIAELKAAIAELMASPAERSVA